MVVGSRRRAVVKTTALIGSEVVGRRRRERWRWWGFLRHPFHISSTGR